LLQRITLLDPGWLHPLKSTGFAPAISANSAIARPCVGPVSKLMFALIRLQLIVVVVLALAAGAGWGVAAAMSLAAGGAAAIVPNALFALRLAVHRDRSPDSYPVVFFLGEIAKIALTVALLVWAAQVLPDNRWPALLAGLIGALQAPFLAALLPQALGGAHQATRPTASGPTLIENR
jgi:ATP synthase protein I